MNRTEITNQIISKATEDETFRSALKQNPREAIASVLGAELPEGLEITVFEETPSSLCLVLPVSAETELSDDDISGVAGGRNIFEPNLK